VEVAAKIFQRIDDSKVSAIDGLSTTGLVPGRAKGRIVLKDVDFSYPSRPDITVCKGYSLVIEPGETVALVGPSGSGKSTLINLLLRFYDPQSGSVFLDDVDVKDLNLRYLRDQIGLVNILMKLHHHLTKLIDYLFSECFTLDMLDKSQCCLKARSQKMSPAAGLLPPTSRWLHCRRLWRSVMITIRTFCQDQYALVAINEDIIMNIARRQWVILS
jgi:ABC-type dipeptide/oligopeptide/nickel transport system ATPase component